MSIYIIIPILISIIAIISNISKNHKILIILTFFILFTISGFRYDVGIDYSNYSGGFNIINNINIDSLNKLIQVSESVGLEIAYIILNKLISLFTDNRQWFFIITSFFIVRNFLKVIDLYSESKYLSIFIFITCFLLQSFNIVRQFLAISITFLGYKYLINRNFIKYLKYIILATLFHKSAIIMIPLYFISNININIRKFIVYSLILFLTYVGFEPIFNNLINLIYPDYIGYGAFGMQKGNILSIIINLFTMLPIFINKKHICIEQDGKISFNLCLIGSLVMIFSYKIWILNRLAIYLNIYQILLFAKLSRVIKFKNIIVSYYMFYIMIFSTLYIKSIYDENIEKTENLIPYKFVWNKNI